MLQVTVIWRMRVACCIAEDNTHRTCNVYFPRQQLLRERAVVLTYTCTTC
jgi:hypothetical protein